MPMRKREQMPDLYCSQCRGSEYDTPHGVKVLRCKSIKGHALMEPSSKEAMTCEKFVAEGPRAASVRAKIERMKRISASGN